MSIEKPSTTTVALVVGVLAVAAGVGAVGLLTTDGEASPPVGHNASDRYADLDGMTATVETTVERGDERNRTVRAMAMRPGTGQVRLGPAGNTTANDTVVVANGSTKWSYDPETRLVSRTDASALGERLRTRGERIEALFDRATESGGTETAADERTPGVSPLPAVPHAPDTPDAPATNRSDGQFAVTYDGTATVSGREVHVLHVRPREGAKTNVSQTLWVDAEWFAPLKYRTEWIDDGEPVTTTVEYRNVTFEPGLEDDTFAYEPPENAALVTPNLGENAAERVLSLDGVRATVTMNVTNLFDDGNGSNVTDGDGRVRFAQRMRTIPGTGKARYESANGTFTDQGNDLTVSNGSVTWSYDRDANNVTRTEGVGAVDTRGQYEGIEQLFARLNRTRTTPDDDGTGPSPGLTPVPGASVAGSVGPPGAPSGEFGVSLDRAERVAGRTAYVLEIRPKPDDDASASGFTNYTRTLWIDAETFFVVQQRTEFGPPDDRTVSVVTYRNLTYTDGFEPGTFTFDPPENATVTEPTVGSSDRYETREATAANAPVDVPNPTVPPDFTFASGRVTDVSEYQGVTLVYRNETSRLRVTFQPNFEATANWTNGTDVGREIRIGNRTGRYLRSGSTRTVTWSCSGHRYSVAGRFVSKPLLVTVAESIRCE
ncbi:hypothetical protein BV210_02860 [Halorientalis sp. IM1011]|uniref:LolA family protein n=1 Tax=Halorientalis sp. IM1011 TaxID=1932360 RepID=UPI00097CD1BF|nr:outer membrane lipoprotein carrier protein LolA [Halorientalis sp. IM1011]AQL41720.1 hypothetical protein BV210_02860 [Halorientalis sp. IM1011]